MPEFKIAANLKPLFTLFQVNGVNIQGFANQDVVEILRNAGQVLHLTLVRRKTSSSAPVLEQPSDRGNGFPCPSPHHVVWI